MMSIVLEINGTALDVHGQLHIRLQKDGDQNDTWVGIIEDPRRGQSDDIGALYYVVAVIFIYGLSIVMMIASHIRKNKQDNQLRTYLKEMASLRKSDRREKVLNKLTDFANRKEVQEALQAGKKLRQERLKDGDMDGDNEASQRLIKMDSTASAPDDNNDSVFLSTEFCPLPSRGGGGGGGDFKDHQQQHQHHQHHHHQQLLLHQDRCSESSTTTNSTSNRDRDTSVSSSGKNDSVSSQGAALSEAKSPTLSEQRYCENVAQGKRSPGFHDYRRWKMMEFRSPSLHDIRTFRSSDRPSPSFSENRTIVSPSGSRSPSLNEFRLSPLCGRDKSPAVHESRSVKWTTSKPTTGQTEVRFHTILDAKHPTAKPAPPASFHVVDEDSVL